MFKTKYRIVRDGYLGYEAQYRKWWMPFYCQIDFCNTRSTIEESKQLINRHRKPIVYETK